LTKKTGFLCASTSYKIKNLQNWFSVGIIDVSREAYVGIEARIAAFERTCFAGNNAKWPKKSKSK
jgi:hypothetical protein